MAAPPGKNFKNRQTETTDSTQYVAPKQNMLSLLKRSAETALKLPLAVTWDLISLGNMGEGSSTGKVIREHLRRKRDDDEAEREARDWEQFTK